MSQIYELHDVREWLNSQQPEYGTIIQGINEGRWVLSELMASAGVKYLRWLYTMRLEMVPDNPEYADVREGTERLVKALSELSIEEVSSCSVVGTNDLLSRTLFVVWVDLTNQRIIACVDFRRVVDLDMARRSFLRPLWLATREKSS